MNTLTFETLYKKAKKTASTDIQIYLAFVNMLTNEKTINIWHVKQNLLKTKSEGREHIKQLCYSKYAEVQS